MTKWLRNGTKLEHRLLTRDPAIALDSFLKQILAHLQLEPCALLYARSKAMIWCAHERTLTLNDHFSNSNRLWLFMLRQKRIYLSQIHRPSSPSFLKSCYRKLNLLYPLIRKSLSHRLEGLSNLATQKSAMRITHLLRQLWLPLLWSSCFSPTTTQRFKVRIRHCLNRFKLRPQHPKYRHRSKCQVHQMQIPVIYAIGASHILSVISAWVKVSMSLPVCLALIEKRGQSNLLDHDMNPQFIV